MSGAGMVSLFERFRARGAASALIDLRTGMALDYATLASLLVRAGSWLKARGLRAGDTVIHRLPNSIEALVLMAACLDHGFAFAPLSPHASAEEARVWARITGARLAVLPRLQSDAASDLLAEMMPVARIDTAGDFAWLPELIEMAPLGGNGRLLIRTSGSTGDPKVVVHDAAGLRGCAVLFADRTGVFGDGARMFAAAPMSSLSGLFNMGLIPLEAGATVVIGGEVSAQSPAKLWHDVARGGANLLWLAPSMMRTLMQAPATVSPRAVLVGMAPVTTKEKAAFAAHVAAPVYENYALSETLFLTSAGPGEPDPEGVGAPLPGVDLDLSPAKGGRDEAWAGVEGQAAEIGVRTPFLFAGYRQPDGSLLHPQRDQQGYFRTGDLGRIGPGGTLRVEGRLKAVLKRGVQPVFLPEIEAISRTIPGVADAAAVPMAQTLFVESYALLIRPAGGAAGEGLADRVRLALAGRVGREAWPDDIRVIDHDIPLLESGKPDYQALKADLARLRDRRELDRPIA